jgi:tetratricopeptide (TPR) repeat protein
MAEETENLGENLQEGIGKIEQFVEENKNVVIGAVAGVGVLVVAVVFLFVKYLPDQNLKAQKAIYMAEFDFAKDSFAVALNGNATHKGFAQAVNDFGWTRTGKLANFYAGVCCLHLKKFDDAKKYLEKSNPDDAIVGSVRLSALGDAYAEVGSFDEAIKYYEKAVKYSDNETYTPYFLFKTGLAYEHQKNLAEAKKCYEKVRDQYPNTDEGRDIEKYIARVTTQ